MRIYLSIILILVFAGAAFGHHVESNACPGDKAFNFKLGMTVAQAEKVAGQKLVLSERLTSPSEFKSASFQKSKQISLGLHFYRGSLFSLVAIYDESIRWQNLDAFTVWLSPQLKLKPTWTNIYPWDGLLEMSGLGCAKTNIVATKLTPISAGHPRSFIFMLSENTAYNLLQDKIKAESEPQQKVSLVDRK